MDSISVLDPVYGIACTQTRQHEKEYLISLSQIVGQTAHHVLFVIGRHHPYDEHAQQRIAARQDRAWASVEAFCKTHGLRVFKARLGVPDTLPPTLTYLPKGFMEDPNESGQPASA